MKKKKNLVVQIYCSLENFSQPERLAKHDEIKELSTTIAEYYAKRCNADYLLIDKPVLNFRHPTYERFRFWEEDWWLDTYDQILYIDTDVFCWPEAPNIFQTFPGQEFKVARHWQWREWAGDKNAKIAEGEFAGLTFYDLNRIEFNAGVFVITQKSRDIMRPYLNYRDTPDTSDDSKVLHKLILDSNVPLEIMPKQWNGKNIRRSGCYFAHLWGGKKHRDPINFPPIVEAREYVKLIKK